MIQRLCRKSIQRWVNEKAAIILAVVVLYKKSYFSVVQLSNLTHAWCWYIQGQIKTFCFIKVDVNLSVKNTLLIGVLLNCWCMSPSQYLSATVSYLLTRDQEFLDHLMVFFMRRRRWQNLSSCTGSQICCLTNRCRAPKDLLFSDQLDKSADSGLWADHT